MPIYEYVCPNSHKVERLRRYEFRDDAVTCHCGASCTRTVSAPHCVPDGMYSYAPNIGSAAAFERRQEAIRSGKKVISAGE